ncbi:hypothetical protein [Sinorhizobium americanum]|uniref:Uncharacterized protein n=1 Tax=Sinorhizobium americanum TaxID=194963 RepID=A0A4R2BZG7_9HYPH|nr:hypothetical protein [Sinorhizobium americanum]TCN32482.1 hypothetical protein EV184_104148 [Sinorhizobium americanum]
MKKLLATSAIVVGLTTSASAMTCISEANFRGQEPNLNAYVHKITRADGAEISLYEKGQLSADTASELFLEVVRKGRCIVSMQVLNRKQLDDQYQIYASWTELTEGALGEGEGEGEGDESEGIAEPSLTEGDLFPFLSPDHYAVRKIYSGPMGRPDFKGRDKDFADFRTRILEGMKRGANFSGEYALTQIGCGSSCTFAILSNIKTGEQFNFPRGGEEVGPLSLKFSADSSLMIATWASGYDGECFLESLLFNAKEWVTLAKSSLGKAELCYDDVDTNIRRYKSKSALVVEQKNPVSKNSTDSAGNNAPEGGSKNIDKLRDVYERYMLVRACYESRKGNLMTYLDEPQMDRARNAIKDIERKLTQGSNIDKESVWGEAQKEVKESADLMTSSSSAFNKEMKDLCSMIYSSVISQGGAQSRVIEKDF